MPMDVEIQEAQAEAVATSIARRSFVALGWRLETRYDLHLFARLLPRSSASIAAMVGRADWSSFESEGDAVMELGNLCKHPSHHCLLRPDCSENLTDAAF